MKVIRFFVSTVITICLTVVLMGTIAILAVRSFGSEDNIKNMVNQIIMNDVITIDDLIDRKELEEELPFDDLDDLFNVPEFKEILVEKMAEQISAITNGKEMNILITENDVDRMVNSDYFEDRDKEELREFFTEITNQMNEWLTETLDNAMEDSEGIPVNYIFSDKTLMTMIISIVVMIALIGFVCWHYLPPIFASGIAATIAGSLITGITFLVESLPVDGNVALLEIIFYNIVDKLKVAGLISLGTGILLIIISVTIWFITRGKKITDINNQEENNY